MNWFIFIYKTKFFQLILNFNVDFKSTFRAKLFFRVQRKHTVQKSDSRRVFICYTLTATRYFSVQKYRNCLRCRNSEQTATTTTKNAVNSTVRKVYLGANNTRSVCVVWVAQFLIISQCKTRKSLSVSIAEQQSVIPFRRASVLRSPFACVIRRLPAIYRWTYGTLGGSRWLSTSKTSTIYSPIVCIEIRVKGAIDW